MFEFRDTQCCGLAQVSINDQEYDEDGCPDVPWDRNDLIAAYACNGSPQKGALLATTNQDEEHSVAMLEKAGFANLPSFYNPSSGNTVTVWLLNLTAADNERKARYQPARWR